MSASYRAISAEYFLMLECVYRTVMDSVSEGSLLRVGEPSPYRKLPIRTIAVVSLSVNQFTEGSKPFFTSDPLFPTV